MRDAMEQSKRNKVLTGSIVTLVIVTLLSSVAYYDAHKNAQAVTTPLTTAAQPQPTPSTPVSSNSTYANGTYTAESSYYVPHGTETIAVTVTLNNGVVTNASIKNSEGDRESARYQEDFQSEYSSSVVGKNIDQIHLSYVAGASDTTSGFNDALNSIMNQAKA